jgi:Lar family restriction alleviation protein
MTPDLLPCPFCGSTNVGEPLRRRPLQVACIDCGAEGPEAHTVDEARTMWNTHATTLTPGLPEGWEWAPTKNIVMAQRTVFNCWVWVNGDGIVSATKAPVDVVRAVLARAGVGS